MSDSNVITVGNVSKIFTLRGEETALTRLIKWREHLKLPRKFTALRNISFEVGDGEVFGIVGRNGSGKSTLLRILAGIYPPTSGEIEVRGRVIPLINLQVGLQPKLTMKDNIFLVSSLFGISRKKIISNFDSIVDFAELKDFVNVQVYQFSSGMLSRLAFSIAIHLEPEVMLLDEVFYAGDAGFREKSKKKMMELVKGDCTVVMVSHQDDMLKRLCNRVMWLDEGQVRSIGDTRQVLREYGETMST
ncbi:MAG: ABC transporter ATP-binding protein [Candidatus Peribacteraceae bacterium]|jgi:ABC-type polysaccharide/polyol phosphate transport system ATPase subunit|nr:ABC transporter ATP-binding protein [Candidatus Peribacteraceae bacterium]|tara:strand:- start:3235 stop:3972 length:738 start_codon:yes stop_codon:yes gene_type:complete